MSDALVTYRRIKTSLKQFYPNQLNGHQLRHLETLSGMISGIVLNKKCHLEAMARKAPDQSKVESRVKRFSRCIQNEKVDQETYFLPFAEIVLTSLISNGPIVLAMDGSEVGRNCIALMISVIYKKRALPLAWVVSTGTKGHFSEQTHLALLAQIKAIIPSEADVIFLGDGEFDGLPLQAEIATVGWHYACRTAKNRWVCEDDSWFQLNDFALQAGDQIILSNVHFTQQAYGPILVIVEWHPDYKDPIYLVSNFALAGEALYWYRKRFRIETFFSDQKSRGFHLHKSHISDPLRLARLMIAACLAYIWIIFLGTIAITDKWLPRIHRSDRCDLSLFQLGLRLLDHFLNEDLFIPVHFSFSVR